MDLSDLLWLTILLHVNISILKGYPSVGHRNGKDLLHLVLPSTLCVVAEGGLMVCRCTWGGVGCGLWDAPVIHSDINSVPQLIILRVFLHQFLLLGMGWRWCGGSRYVRDGIAVGGGQEGVVGQQNVLISGIAPVVSVPYLTVGEEVGAASGISDDRYKVIATCVHVSGVSGVSLIGVGSPGEDKGPMGRVCPLYPFI